MRSRGESRLIGYERDVCDRDSDGRVTRWHDGRFWKREVLVFDVEGNR
jgi:hypothetical protein